MGCNVSKRAPRYKISTPLESPAKEHPMPSVGEALSSRVMGSSAPGSSEELLLHIDARQQPKGRERRNSASHAGYVLGGDGGLGQVHKGSVSDLSILGSNNNPSNKPRVSHSLADVHKVASLANFHGDEAKQEQYERSNKESLASARAAIKKVQSMDDFAHEFHNRELAAAAYKREMAKDWLPEYAPVSITPPHQSNLTILQRQTRVSPACILQDVPVGRKTKVVCTLGPSCWSEEGMASLLDAGMNVARFNFSHGTHQAHQEVLDRLRKVAAEKKSHVALLLDTKGPEIRTAMLRDGKNIELEAGQDIIVYAAGDKYTTWEGYKDEATGETKIGISYAKLCQSVKPGNIILIADGAISIEVVDILSDNELKGRVVNSHTLGQRKNCNLPGVHVDLPVLGPQDIKDVREFAVRNDMDFIAASFVQSAKDIHYIRKVLDDAGGYMLRIIAKVENEAGLRNIDEIVAEADGVMVARGDLAMEVPAEKIALAQKLIVAKCNVAGKFVITATQMLESMVDNPLPTRAEMTDVANAVFDGTDAVMLSGETANGAFPDRAVSIMAKIVENSELGVDYETQYDWIKHFNTRQGPIAPIEASLASVARAAITFSTDSNGDGVLDATERCIAVVLTRTGFAAQMISKYRPACPVIVVSNEDVVLRRCQIMFGLIPFKVDGVTDVMKTVERAVTYATQLGLGFDGKTAIVVNGRDQPWADNMPEITVKQLGIFQRISTMRTGVVNADYMSPFKGNSIRCVQTLKITPHVIIDKLFNHRSTKVIATLGPSSWNEPTIKAMLSGGVSIVRIMVARASLDFYQKLLGDCHTLMGEQKHAPGEKPIYTPWPAVMLTLQGTEVRGTCLRDHKPITLKKGDMVTVVPASDHRYEGFKASDSGLAEDCKIGIHAPYLADMVVPGDVIDLAEGTIRVEVSRVTASGEFVCQVLNSGQLHELRVANIPGKPLESGCSFLSHRDQEALEFAVRNGIDFVSIPGVRRADDVLEVREALDSMKGTNVKIVAHIENPHAIYNYDDILDAADAILISRGLLGLRIPTEKIALAQKWMVTKANLKAKPIIVSSHMLMSMVDSPRPTRAEMTDVANAAYDGADAIMLREETSMGMFVQKTVTIAADILKDAEVGIDSYAFFNYIRNFTPKPMSTLEAVCASAAKAAIDMSAVLMAVVTNTLAPVRALAKYRANQPLVVVTTDEAVARGCNLHWGTIPMLLDRDTAPTSMAVLVQQVVMFARRQELARFTPGDDQADQLVLVSGPINTLFATAHDLAEMLFTTHVIGDEASMLFLSAAGYHGPDTIAYRSTKVGLDLICEPVAVPRKTKIVCTLGPKCWSEEGISMLLENGMNIARFNFSHGTHADHQAVLDRMRQVALCLNSHVALMLDTKGPEIRTAMLRDHQPIDLVAGQDVTVHAVGEAYTTWQGYRDEASRETHIGLSYPHLCRDVKQGGLIKIGDGQITLEVVEVLTDKTLRARALNSKKLGERKNCNLPGVHVDLPVLSPQDVIDVQQFAAKNQMDFIAASFVQSADDVRFIRRVLAEAGGQNIKIISKIESTSGLQNYDAILQETDGIMVARGDLAMEIPSEKVALAQKMMITKANIAGKFIITATQMLESMIENPLPTRAEMTDVANAVFDGTDAVMLSGETANGAFPDRAVSTMAAIVANAEVGTNYPQVYNFIRDFTDKPMSTLEAVLSCAAMDALDLAAGLIVVLSSTGDIARLICKYRPRVPVLLLTDRPSTARGCAPWFGLVPYVVECLPDTPTCVEFEVMVEEAVLYAVESALCPAGKEVILINGTTTADAENTIPMISVQVAPGVSLPYLPSRDMSKTLSLRTTAISLADVMNYAVPPRKTKIVCTLGPSCWSEEGMASLLDAGMNVARFNFSHGTHQAHQEVLDRLRQVVATCKDRRIAYLLDTKGPEIRTAMVRDGKNIELEAGQEVILVAVGDAYTTWEGYKDEATGETKIGISYAKLCQSVSKGSRILIADGSLSIEVLEVLSGTELRGRCLNAKSLGPRKNVNLPGVHVDIPVLTPKDVEDLQSFCVKNQMDFVAASFVQSAADVRFIRRTLAKAGPWGERVKIIAKIENEAGLEHYDDILRESDGIMVARGDLAMEIPSEKVALAQKMMITKANIAGKFIITATQMLESMVNNPLPTRAEMTDVANAVFDGTDAVMLSGETANGKFPDTAVRTMAAIVANAENGNAYVSTQTFIRDHTVKPFLPNEAFGCALVDTSVDCNAQLIITISESGMAARKVSKYRPAVPQVMVTDEAHVANQMCCVFGIYSLVVPQLAGCQVEDLIQEAIRYAQELGIWSGEGTGVVLHGSALPSADYHPIMRALDLRHTLSGESLSRKSLSRAFSLMH